MPHTVSTLMLPPMLFAPFAIFAGFAITFEFPASSLRSDICPDRFLARVSLPFNFLLGSSANFCDTFGSPFFDIFKEKH